MAQAQTNQEDQLKRTPIYSCHHKLNAKFTPFAGWDMPVLYTGVIEEHRAVREAAGLFDVSHMGEISVSGDGATDFLQFATTNDITKLTPGKAQYGFLLNERGGVVDDIITYCLANNVYFICVNASNAQKDYEWLLKLKTPDVEIVDNSSTYGQIALQGPKSCEILACLHPKADKFDDGSSGDWSEPDFDLDHASFPSLSARYLKFNYKGQSIPMIVARTGYTGEDGFEIFVKTDLVSSVFEELREKGEPFGLKPVGLGARDTLRLEACLPLYGHELRDDIPVLASGFGWAVKLDKGPFMGRDALLALKAEEKAEKAHGLVHCDKKLVGFKVCDKGIVREQAKIFEVVEGGVAREVGFVTSGTFAPYLGCALGLAYIESPYAEVGSHLKAEVRGKLIEIEICPKPFYKRKK